MAVRRQAREVGKPDFSVYAEDLMEFDEIDIIRACEIIGGEEREEGQPAFPSIGTLKRIIRGARAKRLRIDPNAELNAYLDDIRDHPEKYERFDWKAAIANISAKMEMKTDKKVDVAPEEDV